MRRLLSTRRSRLVLLGVVAALSAVVAVVAVSLQRPAAHAVPAFLTEALGASTTQPKLARTPAPGVKVGITEQAMTYADTAGSKIALSSVGVKVTNVRTFRNGQLANTSFGTQVITLKNPKADIEQFLTVNRKVGVHSWKWLLDTALEGRVAQSGWVGFFRKGEALLQDVAIPPVSILDAKGRDVTPKGAGWGLEVSGGKQYLTLTLDDAKLPLPYVIDPAIFRSVSTRTDSSATSGTFTVTTPATANPKDLLLLQMVGKAATATATAPTVPTDASGGNAWQLITGSGVAVTTIDQFVWWKWAVAADASASNTVTIPASTTPSVTSVVVHVYRGLDSTKTGPQDNAVTTTNSGARTVKTPAFTPSGATTQEHLFVVFGLSFVTSTAWPATMAATGGTWTRRVNLTASATSQGIAGYDQDTTTNTTISAFTSGNVAGGNTVSTTSVFGFSDDITAPTNSLTLTNVSTNTIGNTAYLAASPVIGATGTVFYNGAATGNFQIQNAVTDAGSGAASSTFPTLGGTTTGWTHTAPAAQTTPVGGPYNSGASPNNFVWAAATSSAPTEAIVGSDNTSVPLAATTTLTFTNDITAPAAPTITFPAASGFYNASSWTSIAGATGTDAGSGIATNQVSIQDTTVGGSSCWNGTSFTAACPNYIAAGATWTYAGIAAVNLTNGNSYTVTARAVDNVSKASSTVARSFTYDTTNATGAISTPPSALTNYNLAGLPASLAGTAADATSGVATVKISVQDGTGNYLNQLTAGAAFNQAAQTFLTATGTTSWTATTANMPLVDGHTYNLTVQTIDVAGNTNSSAATSSFVYDTTAPTVSSVTSSLANGSYTVGQVVPIQVNFSESVNVTGTPQLTLETGTSDAVVNYASGTGTSTLTFNYTVAASETSADLDVQSSTALALNAGTINDPAGNAAVRTLATGSGTTGALANAKNLVIDTTAPTVSAVTSATTNGAFTTGGVVSIQVDFSEAVTVTGTPTLTLETGTSDAVVNYASGSGTSSLTFTYTVGAGETSADLDVQSSTALALAGGTINDAAGNAAVRTLATGSGTAGALANAKNLVIDTTAPTVSAVTSATADGAFTTGGVISIQVSFSESVTVTGTPTLTLETGTLDAVVNYASGTGTSSLTFTYTVGAGETSADLDVQSSTALALAGGTINDAAGNAAVRTLATGSGTSGALANAKSLVVDTTNATATITTPPSALTNYNVAGLPASLAGTSADATSGVATVKISVRDGAGNYLNQLTAGAAFNQATQTFLTATGTTSWTATTANMPLVDGHTYNLVVQTIDVAGNTDSTAAASSFVYDTTAPTVSAVTSATADGAFTTGGVISIQVDFSEAVTVTGTPTLTLETGTSDAVVNYASGSGTSSLTFTYTVGAGETSADLDAQSSTALALNGGTINDAAGNAAVRTLATGSGSTGALANAKNLVVDTTNATATITTPPSALTNYNVAGLPASLAGTAADATSGVATVKISVRDGSGNYLNQLTAGAAFNQATQTFLTATGTTSWTATTANMPLVDGHTYNLVVQAIDAAGNVNSTAASSSFVYDTTAPTVSSVSSSTTNGAFTTGGVISIQVDFSEAVTVTGTPTLTLETGTSDAVVNYASGSGTSSLTFTYTVGAGDTSADLDAQSSTALALAGGTINDAAGNAAVRTLATGSGTTGALANAKNLVVDTTNATATTTTPPSPGTKVSAGTLPANLAGTAADATAGVQTVTITVQDGSGNYLNQLTAGATFSSASPVFLTATGTTSWTVTTANMPLVDGHTYNIVVQTLDVASNSNSSAASSSFVYDTTAPTVTGVTSSLANGAYTVGQVVPIQITFTEAVTVTGTPTLTLETGTSDAVVNYSSGSGTSTLTFDYTVGAGDTSADLDVQSSTALALAGGTINDAAGNAATRTLATGSGTSGALANAKSLVIDTANATATITTPPSALTRYNAAGLPANLAGTAADATSGIQAVTITVQDGSGNYLNQLSSGAAFNQASPVFLTAIGTTSWSATTANMPLVDGHTYNLVVQTLDVAGNSNSTAATSSFVYDTTAPSVSSVTSSLADGAYKAGQVVPIQVNFSEAVTVTGTPTLTLETGTTDAVVNYSSGSGTSTLTFDYTVGAGDTSADLDVQSSTALALAGGTINDAAGNAATRTLATGSGTTGALANAKNLVIDTTDATTTITTPPSALTNYSVAGLPANLAGTAADATSGVATVKVSVQDGSGNYLDQLSSGAAFNQASQTFLTATGTTSWTATTANMPVVTGHTYNLVVQTIDAAGNSNSSAASSSFVFDSTAPTVTGVTSSLADGSYKLGQVVPIQVNFSENVTVTGTPTLTLETDASDALVNYSSGSGTSTLTFNYTVGAGETSADLDVQSSTALALAGGTINDAAGNAATRTLATGSGTTGALANAENLVIDTTNATATITTPPSALTNYNAAGLPANLAGTAADATSGVATVKISVRDGSGNYLDQLTAGAAFNQATQTFLTATGTTSWTATTANMPLADGHTYNIVVQTLDNAGNSNSNAASSSFVYDTTAPTVSAVTSSLASGSYKAGQVVPVQANFSEAVTVTGTPTLTLETGTTDAVVNYSSGSGTSTLTFDYTVGAGDTSADLDVQSSTALALAGGTINDAAGNAAVRTLATGSSTTGALANAKTFVIDTANATATITTPPSDGTKVSAAGLPATIAGTAADSGSGVQTVTISVQDGSGNYLNQVSSGAAFNQASPVFLTATGTTSWTVSTANMPLVDGHTYNLVVQTLDNAGNSNGSAASSSFVYDTTAPTVSSVSSSLANGAYTVGQVVPIQVNFSEAVTVTGTPTLTLETGTTDAVVNYSSGSGTSTLTFDYTVGAGETSADLDVQSSTALALAGGTINDAAGNAATRTLATGSGTSGSLANAKALVVDTTNATATITTPPSAGTKYSATTLPASLAGTAADAISGVQTVTISVQDGSGNYLNQLTSGAAFNQASPVFLTAIGTTSWTVSTANMPLVDGHTYNLVVQTLDVASNSNGSAASSSFVYDTTAPTVSSVGSSTTNGAFTTGGTISIQVNFSEAVTVTGTPTLTLETGTTDAVVNYSSGSGTATLTFDYTVGAGDTSADLDAQSSTALALAGGTINDAAGNAAVRTLATGSGTSGALANAKSLVVDTTNATATITTPPSPGTKYNVAGLPANLAGTAADATSGVQTVTISVQDGSGNYLDQLSSGAAFNQASPVFLTATGTTSWTVSTANMPLADGHTYNLVVQTLDVAGNSNGSAASSSFVYDTTAPTVSSVSSSLANGAYTVGQVVPIQVNFSEAVTVTGTPTLTLETGTTDAVVNYSSGSGTSTLTFDYTVGAGDTSADLDVQSSTALSLNGGTINDAAGSAAVRTLATGAATTGALANAKSLVIDTTNATATITTPPSALTNYNVAGLPASLAGTAADATSGVATVKVSVQDGSGNYLDQLSSGAAFNQASQTFLTATGTTSWTATTANMPVVTGHTYNIVIQTIDAAGNTNSTAATSSFVYDTTAPTVTGVTSSLADGSYKLGQVVPIQVNFSEAVTVTGTPTLTLETGSTDAVVNYSSGSGTSTLTFTYTVGAGDTSADLDAQSSTALALGGGTIKDAAGNAAVRTLATGSASPGALANAKAIVIDTMAPTVSSVTSATLNGSYATAATIDLTVTFSEAVTVTGTPQLALETGDPDRTADYLSGSGSLALTFRYTVLAGDTASDLDYTGTGALALNGGTIKDSATNAAVLTLATPGAAGSLGAAADLVIDTTAPAVTNVTASTANGSYKAAAIVNVTITFDDIVVVTGTPQLTLATGATDAVVDYTSGSGSSTLTFAYTVQAGDTTSDLDYVATTSLALHGGTIKDAAGNAGVLTLPAPGAAGSLGANRAIVIDTAAPAITDAVVAATGTTVTLTFGEPLNTGFVASTLSFGLHVNGGSAVLPSSVSFDDSTHLLLTFSSGAVHNGDAVTLDYSIGGTPLRDIAGNQLAAFTGTTVTGSGAVTSITPDVPTLGTPANAARISTSTPTLSALFNDTDAGNTGRITIQVCAAASCTDPGDPIATYSSSVAASYTVVNGTNGTASVSSALSDGSYYWRARAEDNTGATSAYSATRLFVVDTTAPTVSTRTVNGSTLTITYDETLDGGATPATTAFSVSVNGAAAVSPSIVAISGTGVVLTLAAPVLNGDDVTVAYAQPVSNKVRDAATTVAGTAAGNLAAAFSAQTATNVTGSSAPNVPILIQPADARRVNSLTPTLSAQFSDADTNNTGTITFEVCADASCVSSIGTFTSSSTTIANNANGVGAVPSGLHLASGTTYYWRAKATDNTSQDSPLSITRSLIVDTTAPATTALAVSGSSLTLTFGEPLDATSVPATGDFAVKVNTVTRGVSGVAVSGSAVTLTLASGVLYADTVTVAYTKPATGTIRDLATTEAGVAAGNQTATFAAQTVTVNTASQTPSVPTLTGPTTAAVLNTATPTLSATFSDPDTNDTGTVTFQVCSDALCATSLGTVTTSAGSTNPQTLSAAVPGGLGLAAGSTYYWRARSTDSSSAASAFGATIRSFTVDTTAPTVSTRTVDGSALVVTLDEGLDTGSTPAPSAFTVTVNGADDAVTVVSVSGSAATLTLTTAVHYRDTVTIAYTQPGSGKLRDVATDSSGTAAGNTVASFTAASVTNNTASIAPSAPTLSGPADGLRLNTATPQLSATFSDPDPNDTGKVTFQVCSTNDCSVVVSTFDSSSTTLANNATGSANTPAGLVSDTTYYWRATATDAAPSSLTSSSASAIRSFIVDTTAPTVTARAATGTTLTLTFGESLDTGNVPATSAFTVTDGGATLSVTNVAVSGSTVTLTLGSSVLYRDVVNVTYTAPGSAPLRDTAVTIAGAAAGNLAPSTSAQAVTVNTSSQTPSQPALASPADGTTVATTTPTLAATFSDPDTNDTGSITFEVCSTNTCSISLGTFNSISSAVANGANGSAAVSGLTLTTGMTYYWRAKATDSAAQASSYSSTIRSFLVDTTGPAMTSATINGTTLAVTYGETLGATTPAPAAFGVSVNGAAAIAPSAVSLAGSTVTLTLGTAVKNGDTVAVTYTQPLASRLADAVGNLAATQTLASSSVTNATASQAPATPVLVTPADAATVTTATPSLTATFSDPDSLNTGRITFQVCADASCTSVLRTIDSSSGIANGANGSAAVAPALADGVAYWRAQALDNTGATSSTSATRTFTVDATAPSLASVSASGSSIALNFSEALGTGSVPVAGDFSVTVNAVGVTPSSVAISGQVVTLTLPSAVATGDAVVVGYTPGAAPIKDVSGNNAAGFSGQSPDLTAPTLASTQVNASSLTLTFSESLIASPVPAGTAFTVSGRSVSSIAISGSTVTLTVSPAVTSSDAVSLSYAIPGSNPLRDLAGNQAAPIVSAAVTNSTPAPIVVTPVTPVTPPAPTDSTAPSATSAGVSGATVTISFDEGLAASTPGAGSFSVTGSISGGRSVNSVSVSGSGVTLNLAVGVSAGETVTVSYTRPGSDGLRDSTGNQTGTFSLTATNTTVGSTGTTGGTGGTAPAGGDACGSGSSFFFTSAYVSGATASLVFCRALDPSQLPPVSSFRVTGSLRGSLIPTAVNVSGATVTLTLPQSVAGGEVVIVNYARPDGGALRDTLGNVALSVLGAFAANTTAGSPVVTISASAPPTLVASSPNDGITVTAVSAIYLAASKSVTWGDIEIVRPNGTTVTLVGGVTGASISRPFASSGDGLYEVRTDVGDGAASASFVTHFTLYTPPVVVGGATLPPAVAAPATAKVADPGKGGAMSSSDGATAVSWPISTFAERTVVTMKPLIVAAGSDSSTPGGGTTGSGSPGAPTPSATALFGLGSSAVEITATQESNGAPITSFAEPIDIQFPDAPLGSVPSYSRDGSTWTEVPLLLRSPDRPSDPPILPVGQPDGWYRDAGNTVHILSRHLTFFGVLVTGAKAPVVTRVVAAPQLYLNGRRTFSFYLQTTRAATMTAGLYKNGEQITRWSKITIARGGTFVWRLPLPKTTKLIGEVSLEIRLLSGKVTRTLTKPIVFLSAPPTQVKRPVIALVNGPDNRRVLSATLRKAYSVGFYTTHLDVIATLGNPETRINAVVIDLTTQPESQQSRYGLVRNIHRIFPDIRIVVVTNSAKLRQSVMAFGADAVIPAPADPQVVGETLRLVLLRAAPVDTTR